MTRPAFELADILRAQGSRFLERYGSGIDFQQMKAFRAILKLPHISPWRPRRCLSKVRI